MANVTTQKTLTDKYGLTPQQLTDYEKQGLDLESLLAFLQKYGPVMFELLMAIFGLFKVPPAPPAPTPPIRTP